jgi:hypothetical protein
MPTTTDLWDRNTIQAQLGYYLTDTCDFDLSAHTIYTTVMPFIVQWAYYTGFSGNIKRSNPRIICPEFSVLLMADMIAIGEHLHRIGSPEAPGHAYAIAQARTVFGGNPHSLNLFLDPEGLIWIADPDLATREGYIHLIQRISHLGERKIKRIWVH